MSMPKWSSWQVRSLTNEDEQISKVAQMKYDGFGKYYKESSVEKYILGLQKQLEIQDPNVFTLVGYVDGKIVGIAGTYLKWGNDKTKDFSPWFGSLYVLPEYRKQGLGYQLFCSVKNKLNHLGHSRIFLHTPNQENLYRKWGWSLIMEMELNGQIEKIMEHLITCIP